MEKNKGLQSVLKGNKKAQILIGIAAFFLIMIAALFYFVSKRISPEEIRQQTIRILQENFPQSNVTLGIIDYTIGFSVNVILKDLSLTLKDSEVEKLNKNLVSLEKVEVRIPIWAILTNKGTITINIDSPKINYVTFKEGKNNWEMASTGRDDAIPTVKDDSAEASITSEKMQKSEEGKAKFVQFFSDSQVNVKLTNLNLFYKTADGKEGKILLSRLLIKNLNLKAETAFELASNLTYTLEKNKKIDLNVLVIGEINVHEIIHKKDVRTSMIITLDRIQLPNISQSLPAIKTDLQLLIKQSNGEIEAKVSTDLGSMGNFKTRISMEEGILMVQDIDTQIFPKEMIHIFTPDLNIVEADESKFILKGNIQLKNDKIIPHLNFSLNPGIKAKVDPNLSFLISFNGKFEEKILNLSLNSQGAGGNADLNVNTQLDMSKPVKDLSKLSPIKMDLSLTNFQISEDLIRKKLYGEKKETGGGKQSSDNSATKKEASEESNRNESVANSGLPPTLPPILMNVNWGQIKIGDEKFSGNAKVGVESNQIASENISFQFSEGKGSISFLMKFLNEHDSLINIDFKLSKLNLDSLRPFIPEKIEKVTGKFSGEVQGQIISLPSKNRLGYNLNMNMESQDGEIRGINLDEIINLIVSKIPILKDKIKRKDYKISNNFEKLKFSGNFKDDIYSIKNFHFLGIDKQVEINGKGNIYPAAQKEESHLLVNYIDHTSILSVHLEKNFGTNILPLRLEGPGFSLMPDYEYTLKELGKLAFNKNKEKLKDKVRSQVEKKVEKKMEEELGKLKEKFLKNDEEKEKNVKKLLKGLFK